MITPLQLAGDSLAALAFELPAATTTVDLRPRALLIAACVVAEQLPSPPRLRFSTRAGWALAGTPLTVPPEAQMIASAMSDVVPPQRPRTRTGSSRASKATPATPSALSARAAAMPATWVPCQLEALAGEPLPHCPAAL